MIFNKVLEIYQKYHICIHCLGRMFSLLATDTTNYERGNSLLLSITMENHKNYISGNDALQKESINNLKLLAENACYNPAQKVLTKEGLGYLKNNINQICHLCNNIFDTIQKYVNKTKEVLKEIEFNNFLIGSSPESRIINREDKFKVEFNLLEAESFKSHINRVIGKKLQAAIGKPPEFNNPDILIIYSIDYDSFDFNIIFKSLFIYGTYNKLIRGIPQTHWFCRICKGNGCKECNFTGKQYLSSVEDLISPYFIKETKSSDSKFHGAGREDIDVKMLGLGRPFILELRNPKKRNINLTKIEKKVNKKNRKKIQIRNLKYSNKREVIKLKSEAKNTKKIYKAIVLAETKINRNQFDQKLLKLKKIFNNCKIKQRTPYRVSHRRADKIRQKIIYSVEGKFIKKNLFEFKIISQGGTYIKELINGDEGRTSPSFSEIFETKLVCKDLDVLGVSL
ncbi:MAG: tRNA pseudouridine(54/55) synthase Pus10 [Promethearchaeota archaeon]